MKRVNDDARLQPGAKSTENNTFAADFAEITANFQQKPEIDLVAWASLGGSVKPSRTDRRQKRGWKRGAR